MHTRSYTLRFLAPAFLGDANQSGRWRTPPFKALLRQWWRIAYAAQQQFRPDVAAMRKAESLLFGGVFDNDTDGGQKSRVRLRLSHWDEGGASAWPQDLGVKHPEVDRLPQIGSLLYLGYGPLVLERGKGTALKSARAIGADESATLSLAWPEPGSVSDPALKEALSLLPQALDLLAQFGTVGGRSRNGWGSFSLEPTGSAPTQPGPPATAWPLRPWRDCLQFDWPHALGCDANGPLIWQTQPHAGWHKLMQTLARIKIGLRTQFRFSSGNHARAPEERHWLSYPVTNHSVGAWGNTLRLPNTLRFKLIPAEAGQLRALMVHLPCLPPPAFKPDRAAIEAVWQQVYRYLDAQKPTSGHPHPLQRVSAPASKATP